MLIVQNLSLYRSDVKIFEDVNFTLSSNKLLILKGNNGSGKTSLLKTILFLLEPSSGLIYWKGKNIQKSIYDFYNNLTFIGDKTSSIRQLTVEENIKIWKKIFLSNVSYEEINSILEVLKLHSLTNQKVRTLSLGQVKKLELLRLIIENKKYWILDEPLSNLDSETIDIIAQSFEDHCKNNGSILFSTHQDIRFSLSEEINL
tara:strand:+ start:197 stop:802 length:606 start_codon:yes stop_codon:yes gene_type:complete